MNLPDTGNDFKGRHSFIHVCEYYKIFKTFSSEIFKLF